jgi:Lrp/AsnC family transcriptional regulator, leucine-responsive regulatory protein
VTDIDETDLAILASVQAEGRIPISKLAEAVSLSETACARRLKRLETDGYIAGYRAQLDRERMGFGVLAFVQLSVSIHTDEATRAFEAMILGRDEVLSCHNVTGRADFLLQVVAPNLTEYGHFIDRVLRKLPEIKSIESSLCLREMKAAGRLPISGPPPPN